MYNYKGQQIRRENYAPRAVQENKGDDTGKQIGMRVGIAVGIALVIGLGLYFYNKKKEKSVATTRFGFQMF